MRVKKRSSIISEYFKYRHDLRTTAHHEQTTNAPRGNYEDSILYREVSPAARKRERKKLSHKNIITRVARVSPRRVARSVQHVASAENASSVTTSSAPSWRIADAHSNRATGPGILQLSLSSRADPAIWSGSGRKRRARLIERPEKRDLVICYYYYYRYSCYHFTRMRQWSGWSH